MMEAAAAEPSVSRTAHAAAAVHSTSMHSMLRTHLNAVYMWICQGVWVTRVLCCVLCVLAGKSEGGRGGGMTCLHGTARPNNHFHSRNFCWNLILGSRRRVQGYFLLPNRRDSQRHLAGFHGIQQGRFRAWRALQLALRVRLG